MKNEMRFIAFAIVGDGNGRIIAEDGYAVGEVVIVNVVVVEKNPANRVLNLIGGNCDGDGLGRRDALVDCGEDGEFHGGRMRQDRASVKGNFEKF